MADAATGELGAVERLPGADEIYDRAPGENFSVASLVLGRDTRRHLMAIYGYARLVDQIGDAVEGDRLATLDALRGRPRPGLRRREPEHPVLRRLAADGARARPAARPVRPADRGEPARPARSPPTRRSTSSSPTATSRRTRSASSSSTSSAPRRPTGSRSPTASAPRSSSPSTGRTSPRTTPPAASTCPPRISTASASRPTISAAARPAAELRELMAFEVARARALLDEGAPLVGRLGGRARLAVAGYVGGGRAALDAIDGRRLRRARRRPEGRRGCAAPAPRSSTYAPEAMSVTGVELAYEHCRRVARESGSSFYAGMRLLPPDRRNALFAVYALARRIDDVADGDARRRTRSSPSSRAIRGGARAPRRGDDPVLVAVADAARRFPIPLDAFGDLVDGAEMDVRGDRVRDVRRPRALLPLRRGLDRPALARRLRLLRPERRPSRSPTSSASRSRSGTSSATSARTPRTAASTCPREDLERFGCEVGRRRLRRARSSS